MTESVTESVTERVTEGVTESVTEGVTNLGEGVIFPEDQLSTAHACNTEKCKPNISKHCTKDVIDYALHYVRLKFATFYYAPPHNRIRRLSF